MDVGLRAGPDAADQVQPVSVVLVQVASPSTNGSVFSGRKKSGGLLRKVSPKKPGGVIPTTVNGLSFDIEDAADDGGIRSILSLP